jgi:hypothetical protein
MAMKRMKISENGESAAWRQQSGSEENINENGGYRHMAKYRRK